MLSRGPAVSPAREREPPGRRGAEHPPRPHPPGRVAPIPVGTAEDRCPAALGDYLAAVAAALARRCVGVAAVRIPVPGPGQALTGVIELDPATARPGLGWGPVSAGWDEELGWWALLRTGPGPARSRRYLPATAAGDVAPDPVVVAEFLAGLARGEDLGAIAPVLHRYRLLRGRPDLLDRLTHPGARRGRPAPGYRS